MSPYVRRAAHPSVSTAWLAAGLVSLLPLDTIAQPILDEENPGVVSPATSTPPSPTGLRIVDDENRSTPTPSAATRASSAGIATFRGQVSSTALVDLANDGAGEDTLEFFQLATFRSRIPFHDRFAATLEGRLTWWTHAGPDTANRSVFAVDGDAWRGRFEAELRSAFVSARFNSLFLRVGQMSVSWGSSDLSSPGDIVHPQDLRNPLLLLGTDTKIPLPMIDATWSHDRLEMQGLLIPFFVPSRFAVTGSDFALLRPGTPAGAVLAPGLIDDLIDPSLTNVAQPLLQQTRLPGPLPSGASAGARVTSHYGGMDVSLGYLYDWDRTPRVQTSEGLRALLAVVGETGIDGLEPNAELLIALSEVQAERDAGIDLLRATHHRRHTFVLDGVRYLGPVGVRFDLTWSPERTWSTVDLAPLRRPTFAGALGLGYESSTGHHVVAAEVFHQRVFLRETDAPLAFAAEDLTAVLGAWRVRLEEWTSGPWSRLGWETGVAWFPALDDLAFTAQATWHWTEHLQLSAGCAVLDSRGRRGTLVDAFSTNDVAWLRLASSF
jgi:hypothetical protein